MRNNEAAHLVPYAESNNLQLQHRLLLTTSFKVERTQHTLNSLYWLIAQDYRTKQGENVKMASRYFLLFGWVKMTQLNKLLQRPQSDNTRMAVGTQ